MKKLLCLVVMTTFTLISFSQSIPTTRDTLNGNSGSPVVGENMLSTNIEYEKALRLIIPFLLGLFASIIIDEIRNRIKNRKNRKFIKYYLENSVLKNVHEINSGYYNVKRDIEKPVPHGKLLILVHEEFNTNVLDGISSVEYYSAFKKQFVLLNEIISMIRYLSKELPGDINDDFYDLLNAHLKEENVANYKEHLTHCETCKKRRSAVLAELEGRIEETDSLKKKIEKLIK